MKRKTDPVADNASAHITPAGGNVFADLGFSLTEAKALQAQVREVIAKKVAIKKATDGLFGRLDGARKAHPSQSRQPARRVPP